MIVVGVVVAQGGRGEMEGLWKDSHHHHICVPGGVNCFHNKLYLIVVVLLPLLAPLVLICSHASHHLDLGSSP